MTTKDEVKTLWKLCFNDSDEFTDLYFKMRYKDEVNRVIREDGKIISALQMIPYPMTFCDEVISVQAPDIYEVEITSSQKVIG